MKIFKIANILSLCILLFVWFPGVDATGNVLQDIISMGMDYITPLSEEKTKEQLIQLALYYMTTLVKSVEALEPSEQLSIYQKFNFPNDTFKTFDEICMENGYLTESHHVRTEDGFINQMFRIYKEYPHGKPAVMMLHGLMDSSDSWIMNVKEKAPAFIAAEEGYDVWVPNTRGNKYSRSHVKYNSDYDSEYWDHSFSDMAKYDVPAFIEHIKDTTGVQNLTVIGHSQGTTEMFYGLSRNTQYFKDNVNLFIGLGPLTVLTQTAPTGVQLAKFAHEFRPVLADLGIYDMMSIQQTHLFFMNVCGFWIEACLVGTHFIATTTVLPLDVERTRAFFGHYPAGSSVKCFEHFYQMLNKKAFQDFDYGAEENQKRYGQETPPQVDIDKIRKAGVPIALYVGNADTLVSTKDSRWAHKALGDAVVDYREVDGGHLQFFLAKDATFFTDNAMRMMKKYNPIN